MTHTKKHIAGMPVQDTMPPVVAADVQTVIDDRAEAKAAEVAPGLIEIPRDNGTTAFSGAETQKVTEPRAGDETVIVAAPALPATSEVLPGVTVDEIETPVVVRETRVIDERLTRAGVDIYLAKLKGTNPTKYAAKKIELEARLTAIETKAKADAEAAKTAEHDQIAADKKAAHDAKVAEDNQNG